MIILLPFVFESGHLLFFLREGQECKPVVKQLNWFQVVIIYIWVSGVMVSDF